MTVRDFVRAALAGAVGGIVGGAMKLACEAVVPPRPPDREPPPGILVAKVVSNWNGRDLSKDEKERAAMTMHWIFSALTAAAYGVASEAYPSLASAEGLPLGIALWVGLHEIMLPVTGATPPLNRLPLSEQLNEITTHCVYGFSVERTRRSLRPLLDPL